MTMRMGAFSFAPRQVPTVAAVLMIALTLSLGRWQANRAEEKEARQALLERHMLEAPVRLTGPVPSAEPLLFRRVHAEGEWLGERQIYIDNQGREGRAGFAVITPLRLRGSDSVLLVNRGWTPRGREYPEAPRVPVPQGPVAVDGLAITPPARFIELSGEAVTGDVVQNLSIERYRARTKLDALPVVVLADPPAPGLAAFTERPDAGVAKHREYELTWFALAATTLVLWIALNTRRTA
jgi:surfeit locus 1 family protein